MSETIPAAGPYPYGAFAGPTRTPDQRGAFEQIADLWTRCMEGAGGDFPINSSSLAFESVRVVKLGEGILYGFSGYSNNAGTQFIQVFDTASPSPTGLVPVSIIRVTATTDFSADYGTWGRHFEQGIVLANSSTGPTYTAGVADTWFDAQYI